MTRINLWSSPRNISTALMYSFAQRADTTVVDEPLYAYYLMHTDTLAEHPGTAEILRSQSPNSEQVIQHVLNAPYSTSVAVFKQMTHHILPDLRQDFMLSMANVLLIRDPRRIIASYTKVIDQPTIADIGVQQQYELYQFLQQNDCLTAIVDAQKLLEQPRVVLTKLCDRLGINFTERMLSWSAGARKEDGVWAKHWYANVHQSTGFQPYVAKNVQLSPPMEELATKCKTYYEYLLLQAL
ncbi:MAG: hypothetical protein AB8G22_10275 [Saprospiraceae bacterium]